MIIFHKYRKRLSIFQGFQPSPKSPTRTVIFLIIVQYSRLSLEMKLGVPLLNIIITIFYIAISALVTYWLKTSHRKLYNQSPFSAPEALTSMGVDPKRLFSRSWMKKYTLIGGFFNKSRMYLLKEFFIISVYAVACLQINKVIVWPIAFITLLLPISFVLFEVIAQKVDRKLEERQQTMKNQTVNNINQEQIVVQAVNIEIRIDSQQNLAGAKEKTVKDYSTAKIGLISIVTFITLMLFYKTVLTLGNSISNSGELNICSLLLIVVIDQLAVRTVTGLTVFGIFSLLERKGLISFEENAVMSAFWGQQLEAQWKSIKQQRQRRELQQTASPLKGHTKDFKSELDNNPNQGVNRAQNNDFNLQNLQPDPSTLSCHKPQQQKAASQHNQEEDELQREIYLTTPEKQLFEGNEEEGLDALTNKSILHTIINNKQNDTINEFNKSTLPVHEQSKGIDDLISSKNDPDDIQNFKQDLDWQIERYGRNRKGKKKPARRVLKLTGNSPYLEYLPNMLKNVDKFKNIPTKEVKKML